MHFYRQAELLERKKQKKLRQKEQKAKEQGHGEKADIGESTVQVPEAIPQAETSSQLDMPNHIPLFIVEHFNSDGNLDSELQMGSDRGHVDSNNSSSVERRTVQGSGRRQRWQVTPKSQWIASTGLRAAQSSQASKLGVMQNHGTHRDLTASTGHKVWSRKAKHEINLKASVQKEAVNELDQIKNHEVLIGSISVSLVNCSPQGNNPSEACDTCLAEHQMPKYSVQVKPNRPDPVRSGTSRSTVKLWRPVSRNGTKAPMPVQESIRESEADANAAKGHTEAPHSIESGNLGFSCHAVKAFLAQSECIFIRFKYFLLQCIVSTT